MCDYKCNKLRRKTQVDFTTKFRFSDKNVQWRSDATQNEVLKWENAFSNYFSNSKKEMNTEECHESFRYLQRSFSLFHNSIRRINGSKCKQTLVEWSKFVAMDVEHGSVSIPCLIQTKLTLRRFTCSVNTVLTDPPCQCGTVLNLTAPKWRNAMWLVLVWFSYDC